VNPITFKDESGLRREIMMIVMTQMIESREETISFFSFPSGTRVFSLPVFQCLLL